MRRTVLFLAAALYASAAFAADDVLTKATRLLEKHRYDEAAVLLERELPSLGAAQQGAANMALGTAYLRSAELYRELARISADVNGSYLRRLAAARWGRSTYAGLFYGEALMEAGRWKDAVAALERFMADEKADRREREIAKVLRGSCAWQEGDKQRADELWAAADSSDPEVKLELAAAFSRASLADRNPVSLCDEGIAGLKRSGGALSVRAVKNAAAVYAKAGLAERGIALMRSADLKSPAYTERMQRRKEINFYAMSLLGDLGDLCLRAGIGALEQAGRDPAYGDAAAFYLGEAYALAGRTDLSVRSLDRFLASARMPQQIRDRAAVLRAASLYRSGKRTEAMKVWEDLSRDRAGDPAVAGKILESCGGLRIDCASVVKRAEAAVEAGQGRKFAPVSAGLGRYYLGKRQYAKGLGHLEAARDKGNKNKIEANDPLLLAGLSEAYYRTKKYSEALEIFFEMSKHVPAVRQIQEGLQGIYSMEQKSAGDVKIF